MSAPVYGPSDQEAIALLTQAVSLYSPSGQEQDVVRFLVAEMGRFGLDAYVDGVGNAVGHLGDGPREIVLLGHIDTVPGYIPVRREGDLLYGRGTVDAKGPFATFIIAAARLLAARTASGAPSNTRVTLIGAVEEEAATSAGAYYAAQRYRPTCCVIGEPSGWHRIALGYKGRLLVDYELERPMSHTAGQERGACEQAVDFWLQLSRWAEQYNQDKEQRFDSLDPSLRAISSSDDGFRERVEMTIGLRLPLGLDVEALKAEMERWRDDARLTHHAYEQPFRADKRNPLTSAFLAAIRAEGGRAAFVFKTGTSDMNVVGPAWGCPIVAYGPGDSTLDHTPEEHISVTEYLQAIRVLTDVLSRLD
ncbi:MAG: [LysW]-lysine hydrolase [Chloroflexi bacterium]|jgi:LysW-gamma-L-lysine carboxypeptidase|nr:[LysW]-lysine hydrolase [Chloroflexota bacterium]